MAVSRGAWRWRLSTRSVSGTTKGPVRCAAWPCARLWPTASPSLQQRIGEFDLQHYAASHTLLWAGHVVRIPKSGLPKRPVLSSLQEPHLSGGQEMNFSRFLSRHLRNLVFYWPSRSRPPSRMATQNGTTPRLSIYSLPVSQ
jgi:hypothetical protein